MKRIKALALLVIMGAVFSCSSDSDTTEKPTDPDTGGGGGGTPEETFDGPTYADNYTSKGAWAQRSQWNLANVHDPTVVKHGDYYYMYQTDASYGNAHEGHGHFHGRRSKDLVNWEYLGATMNEAPAWVKEELNKIRASYNLAPITGSLQIGYWAPVVRKVGNVYRMYYSIVIDHFIGNGLPNIADNFDNTWTERAFIGMMETSDPSVNSSWEDKGMVISSVSDKGTDWSRSSYTSDWNAYFKYNAIDPSYVITSAGEHYMVYGSWHSGIVAVQIDQNTGKPYKLNTLDDYGTRIAGRGDLQTNRWQGTEGAEIIYNADTGYYYLFLAYDELSVAYNTRVARSTNILGPYYGINGENVSEGAECWPMLTHPYKFNGHTGWVGISHCSVFQDDISKKWYYSSQGRLPEGVPGVNVSNAVMMGHVREIEWTSDGWPVVAPERFADVPETEITVDDIVGTWEQITMNYEYRVMQTSKTLIFNKNGTLAGDISGTWELDSNGKTINVNGNECKLFDAWNWEASPREVTISYSGLTPEGKPIWAKKIN
ncbi:arabinan endo-1,5-alpha-L-arabinosidase [Formosa sp. S-31]|uniref:arabinan endo-1,5-alpha-L-arabinosidase n=1 Tax=Formosa sp. S-31 TaxID=2790949 RepID=UPI003EBC7968